MPESGVCGGGIERLVCGGGIERLVSGLLLPAETKVVFIDEAFAPGLFRGDLHRHVMGVTSRDLCEGGLVRL